MTLLSALLAVVLLAFTAASEPELADEPFPVTVRLLTPSPFVAALRDQVATFNARHPGIELQLSSGPLDTDQMSDLATAGLLLGDTPYDLLMVDVSWLARYAVAGWLEPLEHWFGPESLQAMEPGARLGNSIEGHLWRMPLTGDTGLLYWRTDLMRQPPADTDELEDISRDLQRRGRVRWGYVWQGRQYEGLSCVMLEVLQGFGGHWWTASERPAEAGSVQLDSPGSIRAAAWLASLVNDGISPRAVAGFAENEALQVFAAGDAAFLRNWPYAWREIERGGGPVVGKVGVTTVVAAPGERTGGTLGTWGLSLLQGSAHPEQAAEAIRWLTGPESQRQLTIDYGYAPTWTALYEDAELARQAPLLPIQRQALANPVLRPPTPLYAQLSDVLQRQVNGLISQGDLDTDNAALAMRTAQRRSEAVLQSAT
ncbi:MAG: extracellular solute-binding protein [Synechococcaceae cyanobacterium]|nr:extracellular solute-binding protein [Synechococcaceae cyanobacterium]